MQDKREPLGRRQRLQHYHQRGADRIREYGLLFGVDAVVLDPCLGVVEWVLAPHSAGAQDVQADPRDDGGQPGAQVAYVADVAALSRSHAS